MYIFLHLTENPGSVSLVSSDEIWKKKSKQDLFWWQLSLHSGVLFEK